MLRKIIVLVGVLVGTMAAPALAQQYPLQTGNNLAVSDPTFAPGDLTTGVSGEGFQGGSSVTLTLFSAPVVLKTVTADAAGRFSTTVTIPASTTPGNHTITATGVAPDGSPLTLSNAVTMLGAGGTTAGGTTGTSGGSSTGLARTGASIGLATLAGFVLVLLGVTMVRRSRSAEAPSA
ncbi:MAG TPA: hypothetical protein VM030_11825 [Acidimicrobiales bacterium]|nr:hypothetical protein [Acidimicrobiales bacterium]